MCFISPADDTGPTQPTSTLGCTDSRCNAAGVYNLALTLLYLALTLLYLALTVLYLTLTVLYLTLTVLYLALTVLYLTLTVLYLADAGGVAAQRRHPPRARSLILSRSAPRYVAV